jgi:hypothetical protein
MLHLGRILCEMEFYLIVIGRGYGFAAKAAFVCINPASTEGLILNQQDQLIAV